MDRRLPVLLQSTLYALRGGFLIRPLAIAVILGLAGAILSAAEEVVPRIGDWIPAILFPSRQDPQVAQAILSVIATSMMTVVSIVFAILLMTLTLASTQFSSRILVNFVRDRSTQWTLGLFLGTFVYCMAALPAARSQPTVFVPVATTTGAMLLVLACVGWLIYFIFHISQSISVNHIVDRIARETELVIDDYMPRRRRPSDLAEPVPPLADDREEAILSPRSGYVRYVDIPHLVTQARAYGIRIRLVRRVGHFVPEGVPILLVTKAERVTAERATDLLAALDIGSVRTMQQDVEFGVIQMVDIALRAISPAINDPSTAISCIDQLSRVLIRWMTRVPPPAYYYSPPHVLRVAVPWISLDGLLDTAFEQIRHYAQSDGAVSLRLLRAYDDIASTIAEAEVVAMLLRRARHVVAGCRARLPEEDFARLQRRMTSMEEKNLGGGGAKGGPEGPL